MGLKADIEASVAKIFGDQWTTRSGLKVPDTDNVALGNDAVIIDGTVLYADLDGSTGMVDNHKKHFSAEVYKAYLDCTARIIRSEGGTIVSYDGDRIMAVFTGDSKNTSAVRCALKINWSVKNIVTPALKKQYSIDFVVRHVVGIDTSELFVAKTGVRGANDLVWVGPAANYAAKLTELDSANATWITHRVFNAMADDAKISSDGTPMWKARTWTAMNNLSIYSSTFWWKVT